MPTVLITRPAEDATSLADRLAAFGVDSLIAPMMEIAPLPGPALDTDGLAGFLVTSANGARALAARTDRRDLAAHAVGAASAETLRGLGFARVTAAGGDVDSLTAHVAEICRPGDGPLLHAAGSVTAGDLKGALAARGYAVRVEKLYEARAVATLPQAARDALTAGTLDGVMLYSPRTARIFADLVARAGLTPALAGLDLFALSANVDAASPGPWGARHVSPSPDQESLLRMVRTCYPSTDDSQG